MKLRVSNLACRWFCRGLIVVFVVGAMSQPLRAQARTGAATTAPAIAPGSGPRLVLPLPEHDFGVIGVGSDAAFEFRIQNEGEAVLELKVTSVPKELRLLHADGQIAPHSTGTIRVALDTFLAGSTRQWRLAGETNDPARRSFELTVKAEVRHFLALSPPAARFTFVQYGREGGTSHVLSTQDDVAFELLGVDSPFPYITPRWHELTGAARLPDVTGRQWQIDLTISKDAPVGPIGGHVVARTTHPRQPRAYLLVTGFVRPLFAVTPPALSLPATTPVTTERPLVFVVKNFGAEPSDVTGGTLDVPGFAVEIKPVEAGHHWRVLVRMTSAQPAGAFAGTLRLRTTSPHVKELVVPVAGTRAAPEPPPAAR